MVRINGAAVDAAGKTLAEYLAESGYDPLRLAVERGGEICALTGETFIIGVTAKTVPQARAAEAAGADYLGVGRCSHHKRKEMPCALPPLSCGRMR